MATRKLRVKTPAFGPGQEIPKRYTADGEDLSPPLEWAGVPQGTKEIAVVVDDPDARKETPFAHWIVYHVPPGSEGLAEGAGRGNGLLPEGAEQGRNSFRATEYRGPAPPKGQAHHYHFRVYALNDRLEIRPGADRETLMRAMAGHVLAEGELVGTYGR